jgi:hypothetical protein
MSNLFKLWRDVKKLNVTYLISGVSNRKPNESAVLSDPLNDDIDFWVEYPRDEIVNPQNGQTLKRFELYGMSGCPVFIIPKTIERNSVWHPGKLIIVGVQVSSYSQSNLLRINRIECITELINQM